MGFDLTAKKPIKKDFNWFHSNVWYWRPIAHIVITECGIDEEDVSSWLFNDGDFITKKKSLEIAKKLYEIIESGRASKLEEEINSDPESNYKLSVPVLKEFADFCKNSGGFYIG